MDLQSILTQDVLLILLANASNTEMGHLVFNVFAFRVKQRLKGETTIIY